MMKSQKAKFFVYFIIVSFIILLIQSVYITVKTSGNFEITVPVGETVTATEMREETEVEQINKIGIIGWSIVAMAFAGGAIGALVYKPWRIFGSLGKKKNISSSSKTPLTPRKYSHDGMQRSIKRERPVYTMRVSSPVSKPKANKGKYASSSMGYVVRSKF